jgi:glucosamine kinase
MPFFLGIDGGGTKTRCILGDENSELGRGSSSTCKIQRVGEACARDSLSAAVHEACVQAGISPRKIARTCAGVSGAGRPEIAALMRELVASVVGGEIEIVGDIEIAFEDAFGQEPGVLVNAGTGAFAYGRNSEAKIARAGGWGYLVSDEGSGWWVGLEAARLALRAKDRGENPGLLGELADALGAENFDNFIVTLNANPSPDFSKLFPVVLSAAECADALARGVLDRGGRELARMAEAVVRRLFGDGSCSVARHGGVFSNSEIVRSAFAEELKLRCPNAELVTRNIDAARGALERARRAFKVANAT